MSYDLTLAFSLKNGTTNEFTPFTSSRTVTINEKLTKELIITNEEITIDLVDLDQSNLVIVEAVYNETNSGQGVSEGEDAPFTLKTTEDPNPEKTYDLQSGLCILTPSVTLTEIKIGTASTVPVKVQIYVGSMT